MEESALLHIISYMPAAALISIRKTQTASPEYVVPLSCEQ